MEDAEGGPVIEGIFQQSGIDADAVQQMATVPLGALPLLSKGAFPQELVDQIIMAANDGELPQDEEVDLAQRFKDKTVIVTGAGSGIGRATLERIVAEGGRVIAVDMDEARLNEVAEQAPQGMVVPVKANITDDDDIARVMEAAGPQVDSLANIAGVMDKMMAAHEVDNDLWDFVLSVNVTGSFKMTRAVIPVMLEQGGGTIVNVASEAGLRGNSAGTAYTVSKHAVVGLTRSEAFLYGREGIRVNAIAPGGVATNIDGAFQSEFTQSKMMPFMGLIPPLVQPEVQAAAITWLLSDDSDNVNGVILPTDGGWSVQ